MGRGEANVTPNIDCITPLANQRQRGPACYGPPMP